MGGVPQFPPPDMCRNSEAKPWPSFGNPGQALAQLAKMLSLYERDFFFSYQCVQKKRCIIFVQQKRTAPNTCTRHWMMFDPK